MELIHNFQETDERARLNWCGDPYRVVNIYMDGNEAWVFAVRTNRRTGQDFKRETGVWLTLTNSLDRRREGAPLAQYVREILAARERAAVIPSSTSGSQALMGLVDGEVRGSVYPCGGVENLAVNVDGKCVAIRFTRDEAGAKLLDAMKTLATRTAVPAGYMPTAQILRRIQSGLINTLDVPTSNRIVGTGLARWVTVNGKCTLQVTDRGKLKLKGLM